MTLRALPLVLACGLGLALAAPSIARADAAKEATPADKPWADEALAARVRERGRLLIHVYAPLCDNDQIVCGSEAAGRPRDLDKNLYWGAAFGHKRHFTRKASTFKLASSEAGEGGRLERITLTRALSGEPWGRAEEIELVVVVDAWAGDKIDEALTRFFREAERGGSIGGERVDVVGYTGHNRMMDGTEPPAALAESDKRRAPIPSFVMACRSKSWFAAPLAARGSRGLLFTSDLMAPEGYVLEALVTELGRDAGLRSVRRAVVAAYAKFQRIEERVASRIFAPV